MNDPQHLLPPTSDQAVVLVVDDEVVVVNVARIALERAGYFVLTAENGKEALEISRHFPATIHAVVSDIQMPHMDGLELREQILTERPGVKMLLISGRETPNVDGCPFLPKPFNISTLIERVRQLIASSAAA